MNISKNFTWEEFCRSETADRHGVVNSINTYELRDAVKALVNNVLQPLRNAYGKPMRINSGYRSPELNALVYGSPTSQHVKGEAADIATGSQTESYRLARLAKTLGLPYDQMILYPTIVHFSHKLRGEQRGQILYNRLYRGRKV